MLKNLFLTSAWTGSFQCLSFVCGNFTILLFPTESLSSPGLPTLLAGHTPWQGDVQNATDLADTADGNGESHFSLSTPIFQPLLVVLETQDPEVFPDSSATLSF